MAKKQRIIETYCAHYENHARENPLQYQEHIDFLRQALTEFPAEEKLLMNLAWALFWKYSSNGRWSESDGRPDVNKHKSFDSWEEALQVAEKLLASSTDDTIRGQCREILASLYGDIGEKEKQLAIAEKCDSIYHSREAILSIALWGEEGIKNKQELIFALLHIMTNTLPYLTSGEDLDTMLESHYILINLWKHVLRNDYGPYNIRLVHLYLDCARYLCETKPSEAVKALEQSFIHAKMNDVLAREASEKMLTSPLANRINYTQKSFSTCRQVQELLSTLIMSDKLNSTLHANTEFITLVKEVETYTAGENYLAT